MGGAEMATRCRMGGGACLFFYSRCMVSSSSGGAKTWLHIQDFEIDVAFDLGLLSASWLRQGVTALERWMMQRFDRVSTISERMLEQLVDKGVEEPRCF